MKITSILMALLFLAGPAFASPRDLAIYSKLQIPVFDPKTPVKKPDAVPSAIRGKYYIGSDRSYAAEPKEIQVAGRAFTVGLAAAALCQPLAPAAAIGFWLLGAYNIHQLITAIKKPAKRRSEWSFIFKRNAPEANTGSLVY